MAGEEEGTVARRVLVVEDEPKLAELVKVFLVERGFTVLVAHDGDKGLEIARREKPELVLSDVLLPRLIGWELCRRIKADSTLQGTRVILMTAVYTKSRYRNDATEAGADDFVSKPLDLEDLALRLESLLPVTRPASRRRAVSGGPPPPSGNRDPEPPDQAANGLQRTLVPMGPEPVSSPISTNAAAAWPESGPPEPPRRQRPEPTIDIDATLADLVPPRRGVPKPTPTESHFDERLAAMHRRFAAALPATLAEIEHVWATAAGGRETSLWEDLARRAHDLAGSAGSFGFPAVGDAARELEEVVRTLLESGSLPGGKGRLAVKQHVERLGALVNLL